MINNDDGSFPTVLYDTGKGLSLKYKNKWLYSRYDPSSVALKTVLNIDTQANTLYLVCSPCLCYGLAELALRIPSSSRILCIESEPELMALANAELEKINSLIEIKIPSVVPVSQAFDLYKAAEKNLGSSKFRRVVELEISAGKAINPDAYNKVAAAIGNDISMTYRNRLTLVRLGRLLVKNTISNLASIDLSTVDSIEEFRNFVDGRPVIVCGAGPSLDKAIPYIKAQRDMLFVLASDTAAGALALGGIEPDAVVCLESQIYNIADFLPLNKKNLYIIADISSHPSTFKFSGKKLITLSLWAESAFLSRIVNSMPFLAVPPLGSVGVLAVHIAGLVSKTIILSGLDFSFGLGQSHCKGSPRDIQNRIKESRINKANASWASSFFALKKSGKLTDPALLMYSDLCAAELYELLNAGIKCYDFRFGMGLPLPATHISGENFASILNKISQLEPKEIMPKKPAYDIKLFLKTELEKLESLSKALRYGADESKLLELLQYADFTYMHSPDPERVLALHSDALNRVAVESAYWRGRLAMSLSKLVG